MPSVRAVWALMTPNLRTVFPARILIVPNTFAFSASLGSTMPSSRRSWPRPKPPRCAAAGVASSAPSSAVTAMTRIVGSSPRSDSDNSLTAPQRPRNARDSRRQALEDQMIVVAARRGRDRHAQMRHAGRAGAALDDERDRRSAGVRAGEWEVRQCRGERVDVDAIDGPERRIDRRGGDVEAEQRLVDRALPQQ